MGNAKIYQFSQSETYQLENHAMDTFNLSSPAGWTMLYWALSVAIILFVFFSL